MKNVFEIKSLIAKYINLKNGVGRGEEGGSRWWRGRSSSQYEGVNPLFKYQHTGKK